MWEKSRCASSRRQEECWCESYWHKDLQRREERYGLGLETCQGEMWKCFFVCCDAAGEFTAVGEHLV